jgi:hypothetical protein
VRKVIDGWELDLSRIEKSERVEIIGGVSKFMAELSIVADDKWKAAARSIGYSDNFLLILDKERRWRAAREDWKKYTRWKKDRNPERARLEEKYGYDTKHGAHLFRLLKMAEEIMVDGKVNVWRQDRDEILAVRNGLWPYDRLVEWAEIKDAELTRMYRAREYKIPRAPDRSAIDKLCVECTVQEMKK